MVSPVHTHTAEEIAEQIGVSRAAVYYWIQGATPTLKFRKKLEKIYGLPAEEW